MKKIKAIKKEYNKEEKRHDVAYERENSKHEKKHRKEMDEAFKASKKGKK